MCCVVVSDDSLTVKKLSLILLCGVEFSLDKFQEMSCLTSGDSLECPSSR